MSQADRYTDEVLPAAVKDLAALPRAAQEEVAAALRKIPTDPTPGPPAHKSLKGKHKGYERWRVGDYRIIYRVDKKARHIKIGRIRPRRRAYSGRLTF